MKKSIKIITMLAMISSFVDAQIVTMHSSKRYFQLDSVPVYLQGAHLSYNYTQDTRGVFLHIDTMQLYGINHLKLKIDRPFYRSSDNQVNLNVYEQSFWNNLKGILSYAHKKNLVVTLSLFDGKSLRSNSDSSNWTNSLFNSENHQSFYYSNIDKNGNGFVNEPGEFYDVSSFVNNTGIGKYQRSIIDKVLELSYSYNNVIIDIGEESLGADEQWFTVVGDYIRTKTGKPSIVNVQNVHSVKNLVNVNGTYVCSGKSLLGFRSKLLEVITAPKACWVEFLSDDGSSFISNEVHRSALWYSFTSGAAAGPILRNNKNQMNYYYNVEKLMRFIGDNKITFTEMAPMQQLVSNSSQNTCFAEPGEQYVVYVKSNDTVTVNLTGFKGSVYYRTYDPVDGSYGSETSLTNLSKVRFSRPGFIPDGQDWVVFIYSANRTNVSSSKKYEKPQTPLFANAGFETGDLSGWNVHEGCGIRSGSGYYHSGNYCGWAGKDDFMSQTIHGLSSATSYTISCYVRGLDNASMASLSLSDYNGNDTQTVTHATPDWRKLELKFTTGPNSSAVKVTLKQSGGGWGWVYFDDLSVVEH